MAAGIAREVFGLSHTILSAGAETEKGAPAAKNAIKVLAEMGIDISNHSSIDVRDFALTDFDLVVIFSPSAAEFIEFPTGVRIEYLVISDPFGGTVETYRSVARLILRGIRRLYVEDALRRTTGACVPAGSHLSGILNRAAKECEKQVRDFVTQEIGLTVRNKATLGRLVKPIEEYAASKNLAELAVLSSAVWDANEVWVKVKHLNDPSAQDMILGLQGIHRVFQLLEEMTTLSTAKPHSGLCGS